VHSLTDEELTLPRQRHGPQRFERSQAPASHEKELRRLLCEFVRRAYRQRLFISTQGSFSARLDASSFLITPHSVDRGLLEPHQLVLMDGGKAEAGADPSRAADIHDAIYRAHARIGAIINAYPVNATAFSILGAAIDTRTIPESYVVVRQPRMAPYGLQFEDPRALSDLVSPDRPVLIFVNDGVLVTGSGVLDAFDRLEVLESTAEALINARAIGPLSPMPDEAIQELNRAFLGITC
jgi:L-fuculose-phosphate aldolase